MDSRAPREAEAWVWSRNTTEPPMLWMPTSKVTRVRRDGFSKISAMNLPRSSVAKRAGRALISAVSWSNSRVCAGLHSEPVSRSLDNRIDAESALAVIFTSLRHGPRAEEFRPAEYPLRRLHAGLPQRRVPTGE